MWSFGVLAACLRGEQRHREAAFAWLCAAQSAEAESALGWPLPRATTTQPLDWLTRPSLGSLLDSAPANQVLLRFWAARELFDYLVTLQHAGLLRCSEGRGFAWKPGARFELLEGALVERQFREACIQEDVACLRTILVRLQVTLQHEQTLRAALLRPVQRLSAEVLLLHVHSMHVSAAVMIGDSAGARQAIRDAIRILEGPDADGALQQTVDLTAWRTHFWLEWIRLVSVESGLQAALAECDVAEAAGADPECIHRSRQEIVFAVSLTHEKRCPAAPDEGLPLQLDKRVKAQPEEIAGAGMPETLKRFWMIGLSLLHEHHSFMLAPSTVSALSSSAETLSVSNSMDAAKMRREHDLPCSACPAESDSVPVHTVSVEKRSSCRSLPTWQTDPDYDSLAELDEDIGRQQVRKTHIRIGFAEALAVASTAAWSARASLQSYELVKCAESLLVLAQATHWLYRLTLTMPSFWFWSSLGRIATRAAAEWLLGRAADLRALLKQSSGWTELHRRAGSSSLSRFLTLHVLETFEQSTDAKPSRTLSHDLRNAVLSLQENNIIVAKTLLEPWLDTVESPASYEHALACFLYAQTLSMLGIYEEKASLYLELAERASMAGNYRILSYAIDQLRARTGNHYALETTNAGTAGSLLRSREQAEQEIWSFLEQDPAICEQLAGALQMASTLVERDTSTP